MFSFVGDTILDPFLGSGTTSVAALKLSRNSIGYEINEDYLPTIEKRLKKNIGIFDKDDGFEIIRQKPEDTNFKQDIQKLPYIFKDPVAFGRRIDPKKLRFGSRIDGKEKNIQKYHSVKKIVSPSEMILDTGARIHLIGIKSNGKKSREAIHFLENLIKGQKVFLRFDETKYDKCNNLLCYVYLKNKTCVNAHLIKNKMVDVDTAYDYRMKDRFLTLCNQKVLS